MRRPPGPMTERDVVLETPGDRRPLAVHHAERGVAVRDRLHHAAERYVVLHLLEVDPLPLHLLVDRVQVLLTPAHLEREATRDQHLLELLRHVLDVTIRLLRGLADLATEIAVRVRLQVLKREVLQLGLHPMNAEAPRERRVDLHRLGRDALLRVDVHVLEGPHVVQAVRELHEQHADVARHRDQHLAEALRLPVLLGGEVDLAELGHAVDEERDLLAELLGDVLLGDVGVLDHVVQERRAHARGVEPQLRDHPRHVGRVDEVRIARLPLLPLVHPLAVAVRLLDEPDVGLRVVGANLRHQLGQGQHTEVRRPRSAFATSRVTGT